MLYFTPVVISLCVIMGCSTKAQSQLVGLNFINQELYAVDESTGNADVIGPVGPGFTGGLVFNSSQGLLLGITFREVVTFDPATAVITSSQAFDSGTISIADATYDSRANLIYAVGSYEPNLDELVSIDPVTWEVNRIGEFFTQTTSSVQVVAMAYESASDTLYAVSNSGSVLATVNPNSAELTEIGSTGGIVFGAAFDSAGTLYGSNLSNGSLVTIDTSTGESQVVGSHVNVENLNDMAYVIIPSPASLSAILIAQLAVIRRPHRAHT